MTKDREEQLMNDVAWVRAQLETYFDQVAPTLATKESVSAVDRKIDAHTCDHVSNRGLIAAWGGVAVSMGVAILAMFQKGN